MNATEALKAAGFKPEKSSVGDKFIYIGVYKATMFKIAEMADKGYGPSIYAQFKIQETLSGTESNSTFPEFNGYFNTAPDKIASKAKGLAKLINGLFSVGIEIDTGDVLTSLQNHVGSEVYIKAYKQEPRKQVDGEWIDDPDGEVRQGFSFMTEANAKKQAEKDKAKKPF